MGSFYFSGNYTYQLYILFSVHEISRNKFHVTEKISKKLF